MKKSHYHKTHKSLNTLNSELFGRCRNWAQNKSRRDTRILDKDITVGHRQGYLIHNHAKDTNMSGSHKNHIDDYMYYYNLNQCTY